MRPGPHTQVFEQIRQKAGRYVRSIPLDVRLSSESMLTDQAGKEYIDFYSGAGTLNYGYDNPALSARLSRYLKSYTATPSRYADQRAKQLFIASFQRIVLDSRQWDYETQLCGPTAANALETAVRMARRAKKRQNIVSFTHGFQGEGASGRAMSAGALLDKAAGAALSNAVFMPYDGCFGPDVDTMAHLERLLDQQAGSAQRPAAVVVETVLGQGGVNVLSWRWLTELQALCRRHDMLLIMDDTQVGCGRTGNFFSFEAAGIQPDIIVLSKSLSGFGLPMSLLLYRPDLCGIQHDAPAQHELTLVTAAHAIEAYWQDDEFSTEIRRKENLVRDWLDNMVHSYSSVQLTARGRGLIQGLVMPDGSGLAGLVAAQALQYGLAIDTSGVNDEVLKLLPALTIGDDVLIRGLEMVDRAVAEVLSFTRH
ncbi:MAG: diaminobutyrate--2-oxoglutarate transaminase [Burkholderiaceae bacterium]|nr:diaminobutyrate--2-oxoglutarate transaminase [Burkholderiaceae bacterium]